MGKWIAEFDLEDGDTMPEHMDLEYKGGRIDFHCRPLDQEPTTKNDLADDCISRADARSLVAKIDRKYMFGMSGKAFQDLYKGIDDLPSVTPQEPTTKNNLGVDCISRAQTQTEIEMNAFRYTLAKERCGTGEVEWNSHLISIDDAVDIIRNIPSVTPQEPILDKIRAEIEDIAFDWQEIDGEHESFMVVDLNDALNIIDKHRAEVRDG